MVAVAVGVVVGVGVGVVMSSLDDLKAKVVELQALEKEATLGPWFATPDAMTGADRAMIRPHGPYSQPTFMSMGRSLDDSEPDADLIAGLRNAAPQLLQAFLLMAEVVEAARARHEVWTRETYVGIDNAIKALDEFLEKEQS